MTADAFYQARVAQHLEIGLKAIDLLRAEADGGTLHSRKLRSFDEPFCVDNLWIILCLNLNSVFQLNRL